MILELSSLSPNSVYHTMTQCLLPRPVAWVLSDNGDASYNLAPFSYFTAVSSDPPLIMLSIGKKPGGELKDTRANILQRKAFVVHIAASAQLDDVNDSSAGLPAGVSELQQLGLETRAFDGFHLPRVAGCPVAMACELYRSEDITASQALIFGQVKRIYLDDAVISTDDKGRTKIDAALVDPIARLGADEYALFGQVVRRDRPA